MKVMTVVGTRPELIRLSRVIDRLDNNFEHILVHTGQNFDFELNQNVNYQLEVWDILKNWYDLGWKQSDGTLHYKRNMINKI
jgi:UDP-N-acetylglucosamine 2-epimerase